MAQTQVYNLQGIISVEDKNSLKAIKNLSKESTRLRELLKIKGDTRHVTQEYQILGKVVEDARARVSALTKEQDRLRKQNVNTPEYKQLQKDIAVAEKEIDELLAKQEQLGHEPYVKGSSVSAEQIRQWHELDEQIDQASNRLYQMKGALESMEAGTTDEQARQWFELEDRIEAATADLREFESVQQGLESSGRMYEASNVKAIAAKIRELNQARAASGKSFFGKKDWDATPISRGLLQVRDRLLAIAQATHPVATTMGRLFVGAKNDVRSFVGWIGKLRSGFGSLFQRMKLIPGLSTVIGKRFNFIAKHANKMKRGLMMGAGIRGLVRLGAAGAIALYSIRMMKEGLTNLMQYDSQTANSVNTLKNSLSTLSNALGTAFAPILNVVAPILNTLINMLTRAATAAAHFFSALTGKSTVVVAKGVSGVGSSAGGAAKGLKKANKAAKEYKRTLMGFDQINKLDDPTQSGSGGSGGGGGGGVGGGGGLFDTVDVDKNISKFADKIKQAWKKADFTEIGAILATKLNNAMKSIPWKKINAGAQKIAKCIGTFINGFVETFDWKLLGRTISNGILVAMNFLSTLLETIHWQSIGKAIVDFISGIKWGALFKGASRLAGNLLGALAGVLAGVAKSLGKKVKKYFQNSIKECGGHVVQGLLKGILKAIKGIGKWIKNNIFKPFIDGFKKAFGISSPSTKMEEQGGYMIDGLLNGLKNKLGDVLEWAAELPGKIMEKIGDITINIVGKLGDIASGAVDMVANFTSWVKGSGFVSTIGNMVSGFKEWVKESKFGNTVSDLVAKFTSGVTDGGNWLKEKWGSFKAWFTGKDNKEGILSGAWGSFKAWFEKKDNKSGLLSGAWGSFKAYFSSKSNKSGLLSGAWGSFKAYFEKKSHKAKLLSGAWGAFTAYFTKKSAKKGLLSGLWGKFTAAFSGKKTATGGIYKHGRWSPVQTAAVGGSFSQGQMFIAREAGPELVGTIGGHTAVMNNDQIVASVATGVAQAIASVMSNSGTGEVNVYLQGDAGALFRVMRQKANDYTRATGQPAFPV